MTHGSLFTGIGGFDLAAEWMGWENIFHCEINKYCQKVLLKNFPNSILYEDIKATNFIQWRGFIDILTGGFPCQPYSQAGLRKGKEDDRHLWPEMLRAIIEIQPVWVLGENVLGLLNWSKGLVFHEVQADLEAAGYEVFPYVLPACAVNAPHRRDRIWFIAHAIDDRHRDFRKSDRRQNQIQEFRRQALYARMFDGTTARTIADSDKRSGSEYELRAGRNVTEERIDEGGIVANSERISERESTNEIDSIAEGGEARPVTSGAGWRGTTSDADSESGNIPIQQRPEGSPGDTDAAGNGSGGSSSNTDSSVGREGRIDEARPEETERYAGARDARINGGYAWDDFPTQPPLRGRDDGIPNRMDRIRALGNAVVPQEVFQIYKAIEQYDNAI